MDQIQGYKLSPQQARLWQLGAADHFVARVAILVQGPLQPAGLRTALERIVARHGIFRTVFHRQPGTKYPLQFVREEPAVAWEERHIADAGDPSLLDAFFKEQAPNDGEGEAALGEPQLWEPPLKATFCHDKTGGLLLLALPATHGDGHTLCRLFDELASSLTRDQPLPDEECLQYWNFSEWQNSLQEEDSSREGRQYWARRKLSRIPRASLPLEGFEPSGRLGHERITCPVHAAGLTEERLLAAWFALLFRLNEQTEMCVHLVHAGRTFAELEGGMGLFATIAPIATRLSPDLTLKALTARIRTLVEDAGTYLPYVPWGAELVPERGFDFEYRVWPGSRQGRDFTLKLMRETVTQNLFKLKLTAIRREHETLLEWSFDTGLYARAWVARIARMFRVLLAEGSPDQSLASLPLLDEPGRHELLENINHCSRPLPAVRGVHQWFEDWAKRDPDRTAVLHAGEALTYGRLNADANRLARVLRQHGLGVDDLAGLCLDRSPLWVHCMLAVLKAGGGYVPMDPHYPPRRLTRMLAGLRMLILDAPVAANLPDASPTLLNPADFGALTAGKPSHDLGLAVHPQQTAYAIYTSGSTGVPKGVPVSHRSVLNYLHWCGEVYEVGQGRGAPLHGSLNFDMTVTSLLAPLSWGKVLALVPEEGGFEGLNNLLLEQGGFSFLKLTPSHLRMLNRWPDLGTAGGAGVLVLGGEALMGEDLEPWFDRWSGLRVFNEYGPTEATVGCCVHQAQPGAKGNLPIGTPIAHARLYVLDRVGAALPLGVSGDLHIGGVCLARGYLHAPALTAARFMPDPYAGPGARMYRTGDKARFAGEEHPALEFLGRLDHQIKLRGYRIEPAEIEAALNRHTGVDQAWVRALWEEGEGRLVAYVLPVKETSVETVLGEEWRRYLLERLPEYMVPNLFLTLDRVPLTPNGKLDESQLPKPGAARPDLNRSYVAPRNGLETTLAETWQSALKLDKVGVFDNFFSLGGDSIRSVRAVALARERGITYTMQQLFLFSTIADLAAEIHSTEGSGEAPADISGKADGKTSAPLAKIQAISEPFSLISAEDRAKMPEAIEDAYPLCENQKGMLFHMETRSDSAPIYHNVNSFELRARFDPGRFEQAANAVVARHPALRTSFDLSNFSEPLQLVHARVHMPVTCDDISHLSPDQQKHVLDRYLENENYRLLDLSRPPLMRTHFHILGEDRVKFTLTEPHAISDGWSTHLNHVEIFEYYTALMAGETPPEPEPPAVTFRDFVKLERDTFHAEASRAYWFEKLRQAKPTRLPRWPTDQAVDAEGHKLFLAFEPELTLSLDRLSKQEGLPLKSLILAAHLKVMSLVSGEVDTLTGATYNGRPEEPGGDQIRGLFLNTVPFRFRLPRGSWSELIRAVYRAEVDLLPHRRYPLPALQRQWGKRLLFEVGFNYIHFHSVAPMLDSGQVEYLGGEDLSRTNFPFAVSFMMSPVSTDYLRVVFQYDASQFPPEQIQALSRYYLNVLEAIAADPTRDHERADLLGEEERRLQLETWNKTGCPAPEECVHHRLEALAAQQPNAPAVVLETDSLTYAELDAQANQMAHHLRGMGVGPDVVVGLFMERSLAMATSLFGILKAGGAYLPLDPTYPSARIAYMLEDSGAPVVITTEDMEGLLPTFFGYVLCHEVEEPAIAEEPATPPEFPMDPVHLAYVIYTSGSTGRPKGVQICHRGWRNLAEQQIHYFEVGPQSRVLQFASLSFDASAWEMVMALGSGAALHLARPGTLLPGDELAQCLRDWRITHVTLPPSALTHFPETHFPDLRVIVVAGEACPPEVAARFSKEASFFNAYGPTETTVCATIFACPGGSDRKPLIGKPIGNAQTYVLDGHLRPPPLGTPGDLYLAGMGLARGYLARPGLSAEKFLPNPYAVGPGARMYRSGDLARYTPGGDIDFLGRIDHQVKLRGFRIELGEIEAELQNHPGVRTAVVLAREDKPGVKRLVGYLQLHHVDGSPAATTAEGLDPSAREFLRERLPDFMVPALFVVLDEFPLTPSGKIDSQALPAPERDHGAQEVAFREASTPMEQRLAAIWREVLEIGPVGMDDNFFDLGGDSLLCLHVVSKAQQAGILITMDQVFQNPTVGALAKIAEEGAPVVAEQGVVTGLVNLTPFQRRILEHPDEPLSLHVVLRASRRLDPALLKQAAETVLFHHDALRTRFSNESGSWQQTITGLTTAPCFAYEDLGEVTTSQQEDRLAARVSWWRTSLDLNQGLQWRVVMFDMGADRVQRLLLLTHPLVADFPSLWILFDDLDRVYQQLNEGLPAMLPAKTTSFKTWSSRLRERNGDEVSLQAEQAYLVSQTPIQPLALPLRPREASGTATHEVALGADEIAALHPDMVETVLLAALARIICEWSGSHSFWVDRDTQSGRSFIADLDTSRTVGPFGAWSPLLLETVTAEPVTVLQKIDACLRAVPHGGMGHGLRPVAEEGGSSGPQIGWRFLDATRLLASETAIAAADPEVWSRVGGGWGHLPLELTAFHFSDQLRLVWHYRRAAFSPTAVEDLATRWLGAVHDLIPHADAVSVPAAEDFSDVPLEQEELDELLEQYGQFEA